MWMGVGWMGVGWVDGLIGWDEIELYTFFCSMRLI